MSTRVVPTPYGRAASTALLTEVSTAKAGSPLAPVTVVVPGNSVGVAVRRLLASGELGPVTSAGPGLVGVNFLTAYRLAELLAAPALAAAGRRPVSTPVVAAAVRHVLATGAGRLFAPVAGHPATEEALVGAHRELADLDDDALDLLARQSPRAAEVVRIDRLVGQRLASAWYDEHDLMRAACDIVEAGAPLLAELGTVVCHLPQRVTAPVARLLRALAARNGLVVVAGLTGVEAADAEVVASVRRLGGVLDAGATGAIAPPAGTSVLSASDPDDEVRAIVRGIVDAMCDGVPLERMAVLFGNDDPYARLLHDHLELAGIAHNGVAVRTLADSVLGRALLRMLALGDHDFRRDEVFALLAGVPMTDGRGRQVPAVRWERISRAAGVVSGVDQWRARLGRYADGVVAAAGEREGDDARAARAERERDDALALRRFVEDLAADLDRAPRTWAELAAWARALVARWIGAEDRRGSWSEFEQVAAGRVEAAIDRLAGLDPVEGGAPSLTTFRRSLGLELDAARDRVGRLGEGLLVGSAALSLGVELDRCWVCGLAEGVFPAPARDDPLLADDDRRALGGELALRGDRVPADQRALLAALASTTGARVLTFPRGDLRRNTEHVPSRFVLDTIESLAGERPLGSELPAAAPWYTVVPSFVHGLTHASFPATRHELDVRASLAGDPRLGGVPELARGIELARARRDASFTRFDGNLSHLASELAARSPAASGVHVSPTRLEAWVRCPHAYFVHHVLHAGEIELPEEIIQLSPLERGNVVHAALERFFAEHLGEAGGRPWAEADRVRLHEILRAACDDVESRGLAGRRLLWARARRDLHAELDALLDADGEYRSRCGATTVATELGFGRADSEWPAVELPLSDGRTLRLVGSADRVDRDRDGGVAVIDYKTGSADGYSKLTHADPVPRGERLQLPVYAHAARAILAVPAAATVGAYYLFTREPGQWRGYDVDAPVQAALDAVLRVIVDGIERGVFVARPPAPGWHRFVECAACDPDGMGTAEAHRAWLRKREAPELAAYVALVDEAPPATAGAVAP